MGFKLDAGLRAVLPVHMGGQVPGGRQSVAEPSMIRFQHVR